MINVGILIKAKNLDKKDFIGYGKSDPFVVIKNKNGKTIKTTEVVKNKLKCTFERLYLNLDDATYNSDLLFEVYDWDNNTDHDFIGSFKANLADIHKTNKERIFKCLNDKKKKPYAGEVLIEIIDYVSIAKDPKLKPSPTLANPAKLIVAEDTINGDYIKGEPSSPLSSIARPIVAEDPSVNADDTKLEASPLDRPARPVVIDRAILGVLPNERKVEVWRVAKWKLVHEDYKVHGTFFNGDSYVIYDRKAEVIYYWIGDESSADESGTAALIAMQFSNYLESATLERLAQGHETEAFLSLFEKITINCGGADSGFTPLKPKGHQTKLYRAVGTKHIVFTQVKIGWEYMNHGDVFVLDCGQKIFVWKGEDCNKYESVAGSQLASITRDKSHEEVIIVIDGMEEELDDCAKRVWEEYLPLKGKALVKKPCPNDDGRFAEKVCNEVSIYKGSDETGEFQVKLCKTGMLERSDLKSEDVFLVDAKELGVWVWQGKRSNAQEKKRSMEFGEMLIKQFTYPLYTRLVTVSECAESLEFMSLFCKW